MAYNVLNRKYFDNFRSLNFIYVIKVYFILFYFVSTYIFLLKFILFYLVSTYIINFHPFLTSFVIFSMHLLIILSYKTLKLKSISTEL